MDKNQAKNKLTELLHELTNLSTWEITHTKRLDKVIEEIALVDIEDIENETLNTIWKNSWGKGERHFPENKYNHAVAYINNVIELL